MSASGNSPGNTSENQAGLNIDPFVVSLDESLHTLVGNINILDAVKPLNYHEQKSQFFANRYSNGPDFSYKTNAIDPFLLKRGLYNLPLEQLQDDDLYQLYKAAVDSYVDKIDQYQSIGTQQFLYNSLRYYGEPCDKDIRNARFILHLPEQGPEDKSNLLDAHAIKAVLDEMIAKENYSCEMLFDDTMIANALVSGKRVRINNNARMSHTETQALAHHELGVHLVTSLNAGMQPLRILSVGCPLNTTTQEGMAILSEHLSGNLTIKRLKVLALRVLAVKSMIEDKNFRTTFLMLKEDFHTDDELAFTITARVYRGGGLAKDFLYLKGLRLMLNAYEHEPDFNNLLTGKTSLDFLPIITRLINKQFLIAPQFITPAFKAPVLNDAIGTFVTHAIR